MAVVPGCDVEVVPSTHGRRKLKRLAAASLVALALPACAALEGAHTLVVGGDEPITITALARRQTFDAAFLSFFPSSLRLRPGDGVRFEERGDGGPHTVTFGRRVGAGAALPAPFGRPAPGQSPTFDPAGAERCVAVDAVARCEPRATLPAFDGRVDLYNSGLLEEGERFTVRLSDDIAPGTYAFICLLEPESMRGELEVVAPDTDRPHPGTVRDQADDELEAAARALAGAAQAAAAATPPSAVAGVSEQGVDDYLLTFGPREYVAAVGSALTWRFAGLHSVTFSPTEVAARGPTFEERGVRRLNEAAWAPTPAVTTTARTEPDGTAVTVLDGGAWDGAGMRSSGIVRSTAAAPAAYSLVFTRPGRYEYRCLVHPVMKGRVVVDADAGR